jgi:hypothetical protein
LAQLAFTARNSVAVDPGDALQQRDTTATMLAGEKAGQQPARSFIGCSNETIQRTMLPRNSPLGVLSASRTSTNMDSPRTIPNVLPSLFGHGTLPPSGSLPKKQGSLHQYCIPIAEIIFER